jgi:prepilin-type N-terminal cleavage/methylation domain-containing protein
MNIANCQLPIANARARSASRREWAFTLIEMLVVIAIIAALAAMIVGGAGIYHEKMVRSRVETELRQIALSIETYQKKFGFYPQDNGKNPRDPARPPLYYELTGAPLDAASANASFGIKGIVNNDPGDQSGKNFFPTLGIEGRGYKDVSRPKVRKVSSTPGGMYPGTPRTTLKLSTYGLRWLSARRQS